MQVSERNEMESRFGGREGKFCSTFPMDDQEVKATTFNPQTLESAGSSHKQISNIVGLVLVWRVYTK